MPLSLFQFAKLTAISVQLSSRLTAPAGRLLNSEFQFSILNFQLSTFNFSLLIPNPPVKPKGP